MIALTLPWWSAPLAVLAIGVPFALWRASCYPDGDWSMRPLVFIFWLGMACALAVGLAGAHYLGL